MQPGSVGPIDRHTFYGSADIDALLLDVDFSLDEDLYFSPILYGQPRRKGDDEKALCRVVYSDADTFNPEGFRIPPTFTVETSAGRYHAYWVLSKWHSQAEVSRVSMKLSKAHPIDASSGIATKLLRVPESTNTKYEIPFTVTATETGPAYTLQEIDAAYSDVLTGEALSRAEMEVPDHLPQAFDVLAKVPSTGRISELLEWDIDSVDSIEAGKRSERRYELCRLMLEAGFTPHETASVVWESKLADHFREQNRPFEHFWRFDMLKAMGKEMPDYDLEPVESTKAERGSFHLLADEQKALVAANPGFVDRWVAEARTHLHPKTPQQYLVALAYMVLAACLGNRTGIVSPGSTRRQDASLYVLNLGPSTTGKTEAKSYAMRYIEAYSKLTSEKIYVGSNATAEGLLKVLKDYDGKSALMVTDEVSAKFKEWSSRGSSQSTMYEMELALFDSEVPVALRATQGAGNDQSVRVAFSQYSQGTPVEVFKHVTTSFLRSGYTARFITIMADAPDIDPNDYLNAVQGDDMRSQENDPVPMLTAKHFQQVTQDCIKLPNGGRTPRFTDEAFEFFKQMRWGLVKDALDYKEPDIARIHAERLSVIAHKMMALTSYERLADEIELIDALRVARDVESWWGYTLQMIRSVSESEFSKAQDDLLAWIVRRGGKVKMHELHSHLGSITIREREDIIKSLQARHLLKESKSGSGAVYEVTQ